MAFFLQLVYIVSVGNLATSFASNLAFTNNTNYTPSVESTNRSHINDNEDIERTFESDLPNMHACLDYTMRPESVRKCTAVLQCVYGQCVATADGLTRCICDEGAVGLSCREKCCRECGRHGRCVTHNNGEEICSCHEGYRGHYCELLLGHEDLSGIAEATEHLPKTTDSQNVEVEDITEMKDPFNACSDGYLMRPLSDRKCLFADCSLGYCHEGSCKCDPGAVGFFCNEKCCKDCGVHGQCYKSSGTDSKICNCEPEFTGVRCEIPFKRETLPSYNMEHSSNNTEHSFNNTEHSSNNTEHSSNHTEHSSNNNSSVHACSDNYVIRPESERICFLGYSCKYGFCEENIDGQKMCQCDKGGAGLMCNKCCKDCGDFGACLITDNGTQICNCDPEFTGVRCEMPSERETLPPNHMEHSSNNMEHSSNNTEHSSNNTEHSSNNNSSVHACSDNYVMRPESKRICFLGYSCKYGLCEENIDGQKMCQCDKGGAGLMCTKCCKDCGDFGACLITDNGTQICNCEPEFSGVRCEIPSERQTLPPNHMEHSSYNTEHSSNNTEHSSNNTEHSSNNTEHSSNNTEHSSNNNSSVHACSDNYVMRPESERICFLGYSCKYGFCEENIDGQKMCQCDKGGAGLMCNKCCKDCGDFGACLITYNGTQICNCDPEFTGVRCEMPSERETLPPSNIEHSPSNTEHSSNNTEHSSNNNSSVHACSDNYVIRPESERICFLGYSCKYGFCEENIDGQKMCQCDKGGAGLMCTKCCKDCGDFGACLITDNGTQICNCWTNYTGSECNIFHGIKGTFTSHDQTHNQWYMWVVVTCSIVLVALIVVLVIIPYSMWKQRVILVMKVVHYFQGFEDDDEREWDAFISYKSSVADERFVTQVLFPKLEEEFGFKLHVHYRDFIPGDTIANNIIRAVKGSRRTILIITPQYAEGEYTKLVYQVAQQQMLKHKHRIIPILLEDISECEQTLDPNLKFILRSVTYLEWPRDNSEGRLNRFWKQIQLSLPKKRNSNPRNNIQGKIQTLENSSIKRNGRLPLQLEQNGVLDTNLHFENELDHYDRIRDIVRL